MESMFAALLEILKAPLRPDRGVKIDSSILLIYPPDRELDFREYLLDTFVPELDAKDVSYRLLDLTGFLFSGLTEEQIESLQEDEFDDYRWMQQGLSKRAEVCPRALHEARVSVQGRCAAVRSRRSRELDSQSL